MSQEQQQRGLDPNGMFEDMRQGVSATVALAQILTAPMEPWMRIKGTFGDRYHGSHAVLGLIAFAVIAGLISATYGGTEYDVPFLILFLSMTLLVLFAHRVCRGQLKAQGITYHSRYSGVSRFFPWAGKDEIRVKQIVEPSCWLLIGVLMCFITPAVGITIILCGCVAQPIAYEYERLKEESIKRQMADHQWEARKYGAYMEEVREE